MSSREPESGNEHGMNLRVGDWVEVRTASEILSTLDETYCVNSLPFMPEMLQYCGKRFRVYRSAHKTCDTIETFCIRRMSNAVHLEGLRCDGEAHGGCQAGCLIFWKEEWLKKVPGNQGLGPSAGAGADRGSYSMADVNGLLNSSTCAHGGGGPLRYRCQATELRRATSAVRRRERFDPRFYIRDITSGNVKIVEFLRFGLLAALNAFLLRWFKRRYPQLWGEAGARTPSGELSLRPGELVQVLPKAEILKTLNSGLRNRGLGFDVEMVPFCGNGQYRVLRRIEKIINERTGEMMNLTNPCIVLDGVVCSGNYSHGRMFCPRSIFPYFREIWLKRVNDDGSSAAMPE